MVKKKSPSDPPTKIRFLKPLTIINIKTIGLLTYFLKIETKTVLFDFCIKEYKGSSREYWQVNLKVQFLYWRICTSFSSFTRL